MKIDVVSFTGDSGIADYSVSFARALSRHAEVRLVSAHSLPGHFNSMGFSVKRIFHRSRHYPIDIFRFFFVVLNRRPDWVCFQGPLKFSLVDGIVARILRFLGIHTAVTVHDVLPHYPRPWSKIEYQFFYRSFDKIIAHSQVAQHVLSKLGVEGNILVVPHGIYDIFNISGIDQYTARASIGGLRNDDFVVLFFGHLEPRKGLMEFISTARLMVDNPGFRFLIAGSNDLSKHGGAYASALEDARSLPNTVIHDYRIPFHSVENYFSASDAVALPYLEGTTSGVLKLALAFGKPVVATSVGDFPEQLPVGAGLLIGCDGDLVESLSNSLSVLRDRRNDFVKGMMQARHKAQWPEIAERVVAHFRSA